MSVFYKRSNEVSVTWMSSQYGQLVNNGYQYALRWNEFVEIAAAKAKRCISMYNSDGWFD